ncbi:pca operon transcription factor PcaQ [Aureimonas jatrophae]|uniref:LysR family transcriptional regulator, pca operon transcriptional activator n=1 Tax=Aureimonas jatrophae TaxID=1166073 RepID=A0A1H0EZS5_9HYPH|nr:pca operon transcription factor PcaQ [Aureimonas jatrophae]MBB3950242.1 LysR family pca operon transcriptional activator [Aureimonas jatrophae]SDN87845.1 LysR family transcriptional regulator, pca operon transcriptional activator [Aureimonas jatrophae]
MVALDPAVRLRHLATFVAVARVGSVSRAAERLHVTQPAVSKTLRELETLLGAALFDRAHRTVTLTSFGLLFLRHAEAGLEAFDEGARALKAARDPASLPLRIGALPTVSARLMPMAMQRFLAEGVGAVPRVVTGPNDYLLAQLREGQLDVVIGRMADPEAMDGFLFEPLYSEPLCLAVRPNHPLLAAPAFRPAAIATALVLVPPPGSVIRSVVDRFLLSAGIPAPLRVVETVSLAFGRAFLLDTDAVWIISEGVVARDLAEGTLRRLPLDMATTRGAVGVTRRARVALPASAEIFLANLHESARIVMGPA